MAAPFGALFAAAVLYALCNKPGEQGYLFVVIGIGSPSDERPRPVRHVHPVPVHLTSLYLWNIGNFVGQGYGTLLPVSLLLCSSVPGPSVSPLPRRAALGPVTASTSGST